MSKLNIRIKELRTERGLSIRQLAEFFDVTVRAVQRWETGENIPSVEIIIKIAIYFEVTTDYLFGLED